MSACIKTFLAGSLGLFLLLACDSPTQSGGVSAVGTWKGKAPDSIMTLIAKADLSFTAELPNPYGTYAMTGTYALKGNTITLTYASSLQGSEGIPPPTSPVDGTISGTSLTIPIPYNYTGASATLKKQ